MYYLYFLLLLLLLLLLFGRMFGNKCHHSHQQTMMMMMMMKKTMTIAVRLAIHLYFNCFQLLQPLAKQNNNEKMGLGVIIIITSKIKKKFIEEKLTN